MDWNSVRERLPAVGAIVRLQFRDPLGYYESGRDCFLHDDGCWYAIEPPTKLAAQPTHWSAK